MTGLEGIRLRRHEDRDLEQVITAAADLYERVYTEPPYNGGPLFTRHRFLQRTDRQKQTPGFVLVTACAEDVLVGFALGLPFGEGHWWRGTSTPQPPADLVAAEKFAVIELVVHPDRRGRGLGHALLDVLLNQRPEQYAILLAEPTAPARKLYDRWGWQQVGEVQPTDDAPLLHALARRLNPANT
ncbi:GNAT family N-acetyltransferase [Micromonospora sp. C51]|uniref:GNAT family N-acetyltransferase n=1 Tax=Micromonospora sp. C51 TaxID=2824879 RepID=UPI001B39489B|nr:GNAT family N-acetyltransferase [Micromonospora sp. C51]MBQ1051831.1 GNAT family N-acetyltransferase [Micromonospora sp. C51]